MAISEGDSWKLMTKEEYDTDADTIADKAEGIESVEDFPESPTIGDMVEKSGKVYVRIET